MTTIASPTDRLGYDALFVDGDLDPAGRAATGEQLVLEMARARLLHDDLPVLQTDGSTAAVEFGEDARRWIGEATTPGLAAAKGARVTELLCRDGRVEAAPCTVSLAPGGTTLSDRSRAALVIDVTLHLSTGATLSRVVGVSAVSVEFLAQGS